MDTKVLQSPSTLQLTVGESAQIQCCWDLTESLKKRKTEPKMDLLQNDQRVDGLKRQQMSVKQTCSLLVIQSVKTEDSGLYVCKVYWDIPTLYEMFGTGTQLTVAPLKTETKHKDRVPAIPANPAIPSGKDGERP